MLVDVHRILRGCVRYGTGILRTGMDVVLNLAKCPVPVLTSNRTYRSVRHRYSRCTDLTEVSGTGTKVCTGTAGTGIDVLNLPKIPVPVLMSYRTYRTGRTELTVVSGTGIDVAPNLPKCPVPGLISYRTYRNVRYQY